MTTVFERVAAALLTTGVPFANGQYIAASGQPLPDVFMTYILVADRPAQHADNGERSRTSRVQVSTYSRLGLADLPDVKAAMCAAGFMAGARYQIPYDRDTGHYGLASEYVILEDVS